MAQTQKSIEQKRPPKVERAFRLMAQARELVESLNNIQLMVAFNAFCEGGAKDPRRYTSLSTLPELRGETPEVRAQELLDLLKVKKPKDIKSIIPVLRMEVLVERAHVLIHENCMNRAEELIAAIKGIINPESQTPEQTSENGSGQPPAPNAVSETTSRTEIMAGWVASAQQREQGEK